MIKIEKTVTPSPDQWDAIIRGMRNPMNSWAKTDSEPGCEIVSGSHEVCRECDDAIYIHGERVCGKGYTPDYVVGFDDHDLMTRLAKNGPVHAKYRRMITVYVDITAPLYWWKEFDTYKVGTVANSCSTMHKIHSKEFTMDDFSTEHLFEGSKDELQLLIGMLNVYRHNYIEFDNVPTHPCYVTKKDYWWQMIQLLPSSYNQKRTVLLNYEVLNNIYHSRKNHKLDEWRELCAWIEALPYSELVTGEKEES